MTYLTACLLALGAGFGALLVIPQAFEQRPALAADIVPSEPPSPPQSFNLFDPVASPHATMLPAPKTPAAKSDADAAPLAVRAETEPATELPIAERPVTESRRVVELPPAWEQPQAPRPPQTQRPALKRHAATAAVKPQDRPLVRTRTARREQSGKRPSEALRTVRKFSDDLQDIPVTAYAGDGTRRSVVIHPTSIQDVYYYSVPR
jgi:hypothetical protein